MYTPDIIERAFQLAGDSTSVEEVRKALRSEGYQQVDAHLSGASIKADLKKRFLRRPEQTPTCRPIASETRRSIGVNSRPIEN